MKLVDSTGGRHVAFRHITTAYFHVALRNNKMNNEAMEEIK